MPIFQKILSNSEKIIECPDVNIEIEGVSKKDHPIASAAFACPGAIIITTNRKHLKENEKISKQVKVLLLDEALENL